MTGVYQKEIVNKFSQAKFSPQRRKQSKSWPSDKSSEQTDFKRNISQWRDEENE